MLFPTRRWPNIPVAADLTQLSVRITILQRKKDYAATEKSLYYK